MVKSANDVAVVVAEALGGTEVEFARMMTRKAQALGMSRTTFRNASGLPNRKQRSTARDMSHLARALMRDFPHRYHYFDDQRFRYGGRAHRSPNRLLGSYSGMDGIKTGYIRASGFNLVASAERDGRRVVAVVFGGKTARSRNKHMATLLDLGFTRIAERDAKRGRVRYAGIPRPPRRLRPGRAGCALQACGDHGRGCRAAGAGRRGCGASGRADRDRRGNGGGGCRGLAACGTPARKAGGRDDDGRGADACTRISGVAEGVPGGFGDRPPLGIQVGAYESVTSAQIAMRRASARAPLLGDAMATLVPIDVGPGTLYRARFLGLYKSDAVRACRALRASPMPCVIIRGLDAERDPAVRAAS